EERWQTDRMVALCDAPACAPQKVSGAGASDGAETLGTGRATFLVIDDALGGQGETVVTRRADRPVNLLSIEEHILGHEADFPKEAASNQTGCARDEAEAA